MVAVGGFELLIMTWHLGTFSIFYHSGAAEWMPSSSLQRLAR